MLAAVLLVSAAHGQQPIKRDPKINSFYTRAISAIKPDYRQLVANTSSQFTRRSLDADSLTKALRKNPQLSSLTSTDIETLTLLVLVETSGKMEVELHTLLEEVKRTNSSKMPQRNSTTVRDSSVASSGSKTDKDDMQELSEEKMFRIRKLTEARDRLERTISNMMTKSGDSEGAISPNLKS